MDNYDTLWAFDVFCEEVKTTSRHFLSDKALKFLEWLNSVALEDGNNKIFKKNSTAVFRARNGAEYIEFLRSEENEEGEEIEFMDFTGASARTSSSDYFPITRMLGSGGRANPEGIPFLYVATTPFIAVSEVRPFINDEVSVACMCPRQDLKVADFSGGIDFSFCFAKYDKTKELANNLPKEKIIEMVIREVGNAFSRPIPDKNKAMDYLPTQIIAEYFHSKGFDGIGFRSQFETCNYDKNRDDSLGEITVRKEGGYNVVFFNKEEFYVHSASVYRMKKALNFIELIPETHSSFENRNLLDCKKIREYFGMEQDVFAHHIGAEHRDLVNWEKGIGRPNTAQYKILKMLREKPKETMDMLKK